MKNLVVYYSQFGNTMKIAQAIGEGIREYSGHCDILHIRDVTPEDWMDYDLVGIGAPIWSSCPTTNVIYMIKNLPNTVAGKHSFFFCTHGTTPGRCVLRGVEPMLEKGLVVLGWKDWYCGASLPLHPKPWFTDGHPDDIDLAEAKAYGVAMATHSRLVSDGMTGIIPKLPSPAVCDELYGADSVSGMLEMIKQNGGKSPFGGDDAEVIDPEPPKYPATMNYLMSTVGAKFTGSPLKRTIYVDAELCINCGRCVKACFCDNIDGTCTPPRVKSQMCEQCMFCESVCPTGALKYKDAVPHPSSGAAQQPGGLMEREITLAEAKGRFRRVIPVEQVGWDTPWEVATTHPRIKDIP